MPKLKVNNVGIKNSPSFVNNEMKMQFQECKI